MSNAFDQPYAFSTSKHESDANGDPDVFLSSSDEAQELIAAITRGLETFRPKLRHPELRWTPLRFSECTHPCALLPVVDDYVVAVPVPPVRLSPYTAYLLVKRGESYEEERVYNIREKRQMEELVRFLSDRHES